MMRLTISLLLVLVLTGCDDDAPPADAGPDGATDGSTDSGADGSDDGDIETCEENDECDDGLYCNGVETCNDGRCLSGTAVDCGGPDGCEMGDCSEDEDRCVTVPRDDDGDGQSPERCGGEDCDDSEGDVFRGAVERCNGLDDDCDSRSDESVATRVIETRHSAPPDLVVRGDESYLVWAEQTLPPTPGPRSTVIRVSAGGTVVGEPLDLGQSAGSPAMAVGDDGLGVLWISGCESPSCHPRLHFMSLDWSLEGPGDDVLLDEEEALPADPELVWTGEGWVALWSSTQGEASSLRLARLEPSGTPTASSAELVPAEDEPSHPEAIWTGSSVVMAWTALRDGEREVFVARMAPDGELAAPPTVPFESGGAAVAWPTLDWTGSEIALAWETDADHPGRFDLLFGRLSAATEPLGETQLVTGVLTEGSSGSAQLLWNDGHHVLVWHHRDGDVESIYYSRIEDSGAMRDDPIWIDRAEGRASGPRVMAPSAGLVVGWGGDYLDRFDGRGLYLSRVCL